MSVRTAERVRSGRAFSLFRGRHGTLPVFFCYPGCPTTVPSFQYGPHPFRQAASCSLMDEREAAQANRGQVADVAFSDIVVQQFRKAVVRPFRPCKAVYGLIGDIRPAQGQLRLPEQIIAAFIVTVAHGIVRQPAFSVHIEKDERSALFQIGFFSIS